MSDRSLVCFENHQNGHKGYTNINTNHETQRFQLQRRKMTENWTENNRISRASTKRHAPFNIYTIHR